MRILIVMAHPDDEIIFAFPIMQDTKDNDVSLLTLSNNAGKRGRGPIEALEEVCEKTNVRLLDFPRTDNNFYRLPPRYENYVLSDAIKLFNDNIEKAINLTRPDCIFTHNPMGEYGHGDHRFTFNLVSMFDIPLMLTDICFANGCHLSSDMVPGVYSRYLFAEKDSTHHVLNEDWFAGMKGIYERYNAWSWSGHEPIRECNLYLIE